MNNLINDIKKIDDNIKNLYNKVEELQDRKIELRKDFIKECFKNTIELLSSIGFIEIVEALTNFQMNLEFDKSFYRFYINIYEDDSEFRVFIDQYKSKEYFIKTFYFYELEEYKNKINKYIANEYAYFLRKNKLKRILNG